MPKSGGLVCLGMIWKSHGSNFRSSVGQINLAKMNVIGNTHQLSKKVTSMSIVVDHPTLADIVH